MALNHHTADCTGRWRKEEMGGGRFWRCEQCFAAVYDSDLVALAAIRENLLGTILLALTDAGAWRLEEERKGNP